MKYAVLILREGETDDSPRSEYVVEAKDKQSAIAEGKRFIRRRRRGCKAHVARVRRLSQKEVRARYGDYARYMNGGYLDYFNSFTDEGYLN